MKLYKYYSVTKNSLGGLINNFVWYSEPKNFNDPFDSALINNEYLQSISLNYTKAFCLAENPYNYLMWSHYADAHKGFCLEFTDYTDDELDILKERGIFPKDTPHDKLAILRNARPVEYKTIEEIDIYVKDIPQTEAEFEAYFTKLPAAEREAFLAKIDSTSYIKHKDWEYEKEYRIITLDEKNILYPPGKITAVYFGLKMPAPDKRSIALTLDPDLKGACSLYQMYREKGSSHLKSRPFDKLTDLQGMTITYGP